MKPSYFEVQIRFPDRHVAAKLRQQINPKLLCKQLQKALANGSPILGRAHQAGNTLYVYVTLKDQQSVNRCGARLQHLTEDLLPLQPASLKVYGYSKAPSETCSACLWLWSYSYMTTQIDVFEMPEVLRVKLGAVNMHPGDYSRCMLDYLVNNPTKTANNILGR